MNKVKFLTKKLKKLEKEFEKNPKAEIRNRKILAQAEKTQKEIESLAKNK